MEAKSQSLDPDKVLNTHWLICASLSLVSTRQLASSTSALSTWHCTPPANRCHGEGRLVSYSLLLLSAPSGNGGIILYTKPHMYTHPTSHQGTFWHMKNKFYRGNIQTIMHPCTKSHKPTTHLHTWLTCKDG